MSDGMDAWQVPAWVNQRSRIYWYDQYTVNEQATAFAAYDPDRIVDELVGTGADIVAVYAANQYSVAYYPSAIWPMHPGLKGRDYVGDLASRLRAKGKKVLLYINWLEGKHAEWNVIRPGCDPEEARAELELTSWAEPDEPNGRVQVLPGGGWQMPCINSPKREQVVNVARELVQRYHPDAFHLDMLFEPAVCVCPYCRPELEALCGTSDLTHERVMAHWREFIDWRCRRVGEIFADVTAVLHEHGVVAAHNAFAPLSLPAGYGISREWLPSLDVFVSECFDAFRAACTDLNSTSINVRWQHAVGKPAWILRTSTPSHFCHWPITPAQWQIYAAACKANGAKVFGPCGIGAHADTTSSAALLKSVTDAFDVYMQDADLDEGAASVAKVALLFSWATRRYYEAEIHGMQWAESFMGWARLLIEEHVPFDIVVADDLTGPDALTGYDLVVLPNLANLSDACCEALRAYVADGGRVVATGETSLRDEQGGTRVDFELSDVLGLTHRGSADGPFAMDGHAEPEPACGLVQHVAADGPVLARIVDVDPAGPVSRGHDPLPLAPSAWPAIVQHGFKDGQTLYVAFPIGRYYTQHGDLHVAVRMAELLDTILPERQLVTNAPRTVEMTVWRQREPERTIVHLANRSVAWSLPTDERQISEVLPVHDVEIRLRPPYERWSVSARAAAVTAAVEAEHLVLHVPVLAAYAAVVIESPE